VLLETSEVMASSIARSRGLSIVRPHPNIGRVACFGPGPRLSRTPVSAASPAGLPGADTRAVLTAAGLADEVPALLAERIIAEHLDPGVELRL
jgi:crotonobetainyl-CoA:carnitine CoA-transferase CaiB-like acyl-CoA transferase